MNKCLIVDDSKVVRKFSKSIVESLGFESFEAQNGDEALKTCETMIPDIILLDWNMPVLDGLGFLEKFKEKYPTSTTKIIFCSTENELNKIKQAMSSGANEYIMKPFDLDVIKTKFINIGLLDGE